ncbi:MAG: hypothetical protein ACRC0A_03210 [Chitinophagaceae bacterium]
MIDNNIQIIDTKEQIFDLLEKGAYTIKEIKSKLQISWTDKKLRDFLKSQENISIIPKKPLRFTHLNNNLYFN